MNHDEYWRRRRQERVMFGVGKKSVSLSLLTETGRVVARELSHAAESSNYKLHSKRISTNNLKTK